MSSVAASLLLCNPLLLDAKNAEFMRLWWAVCWVESHGDPQALNSREGAVGIAQIRMISLRDANRIIGREKYRSDDRLDPVKSFEMFRLLVRYYAPCGTPEQWSRIWNGGPDGPHQASTLRYWHKIEAVMQAQKR